MINKNKNRKRNENSNDGGLLRRKEQ